MSDVPATAEKISSDEIRDLLYHTREATRIIARWTPTDVDDRAVAILDLIPGIGPPQSPSEPQALSIPWDSLPWERLLPLLLPLIQKALIAAIEKWLNSLSEKK